MGEDEADTLALAPKPAAATVPTDPNQVEPQGQPKSLFDRTHVGPKGAALFAEIVLGELLKLRPELKPAAAARAQ
jgi:lysophospholipase L1-like esterase